MPLPVNTFPNKIAPNVPNNVLRNLSFCYFGINKPDFSRDLTILKISFKSSFEFINVVIPDPKVFLWIAASVADAAVVYPNDIKHF